MLDNPADGNGSGPAPDLDDTTLGGYFRVHNRPPAFEGSDGHPYTVSLEVEKTGDLRAPFHAYLVFPRWADTGVGIVGHVETGTLFQERSKEAALEALGAMSLGEVRAALDEAVDADTDTE